MSTKKFIIAIVILVIIVIWIWPSGKSSGFKIKEVVDGNTVILDIGTKVKLIGVNSTMSGMQKLNEYNNSNPVVYLQYDKSAYFDVDYLSKDMTVYAYLLVDENDELCCVNSVLLKEGFSDLLENSFLQDSLEIFRKYASSGAEEREVEPVPAPVKKIVYRKDSIVLPTPPKRDYERRYSSWSFNGDNNLAMLNEACDYNCPYTKKFANSLAGRKSGSFSIEQVCEVFDYCVNNWSYVNDPKGSEYLAMASETIENSLTGDCDDFAVLMASCMLSIGGYACVNVGSNPESAHAFTEVDIAPLGSNSEILSKIKERFPQYASSIESLYTRQDGNHLWLNLDWWARYPGGPYYDCSVSRDAYPCVDGEWSWNKLN